MYVAAHTFRIRVRPALRYLNIAAQLTPGHLVGETGLAKALDEPLEHHRVAIRRTQSPPPDREVGMQICHLEL